MNRIKLLMVDDEIDFTSTLTKRLTKRGINPTTVSNGAEALAVLENNEMDIVLLDIKMPEMDGIKALEKIKRLYPYTEVIMLTAHANSDIVLSCLGMGAFGYLMKPVDVDTLVGKIEDAKMCRNGNLEHDRCEAERTLK